MAEIRAVGIDYITVTSKTRNSDSGLDAFGRYLVETEIAEGCKSRNYGASGYRGLICGHAAFGRRSDGSLLRISSYVADEHWSQALSLSDNCTRLDPQITVYVELGCAKIISRHYNQIRRKQVRNGRPPKFKLWVGPSGPEALAIGRRISNRYWRVYDKGLESGVSDYQNCVRYEGELKSAVALALATKLDQTASWRLEIAQYVLRSLAEKQVRIPISLHLPVDSPVINDIPNTRARAYGRDRTLAWLQRCVRPSATRLIERGFKQEVLAALGILDAQTLEQDASYSSASADN